MTKPPYRVPLVAETAREPRNGLKVASTFSGGGGSCYGYELAGYEVVWANEFVASAQATYRANHPKTILDERDIRQVQASEILDATGLAAGELDLFDGSPPCQSFSTIGKREKSWGKNQNHCDGARQKSSDDLFFEYARLLKDLQPKTFIAENVSGLVKGTAKGYFKLIINTLRECGYVVEARLLDASWLGVPQRRQRLIFQGIRNDLALVPVWPTPFEWRYSVSDALVGLENAPVEPSAQIGRNSMLYKLLIQLAPGQSGNDLGKGNFSLHRLHPNMPAPTVLAGSTHNLMHPTQNRRSSISELRRFSSFPDDYVLTGSFADQWCRMGNSVPPLMMKAIAATIAEQILLPLGVARPNQ